MPNYFKNFITWLEKKIPSKPRPTFQSDLERPVDLATVLAAHAKRPSAYLPDTCSICYNVGVEWAGTIPSNAEMIDDLYSWHRDAFLNDEDNDNIWGPGYWPNNEPPPPGHNPHQRPPNNCVVM